MEPSFKNLFKLTNSAMNINQSHPFIRKGPKWFLIVFISYGIFFMLFLLCLYNIIHDMKNSDLSKTCKDGTLLVIYITNTFQFFIILWKTKYLRKIMITMQKDYDNMKNLSLYEQKIMLDYAKLGARVGKQWLFMGICGVGLFLIKNVVLHLNSYVQGDFHLIQFYDLVYPKFIDVRKDVFIVFINIYLLLIYYGLYAAFMYVSYAPLGPIFLTHACGKLDILSARLDSLYDGRKEIFKELRSIAIDLQDIYCFVDEIKTSFRVAYELSLKAATVMLPVTAYEMREAFGEGEVSLEFLSFLLGAVLYSSLPCYYSELLMERGERFRLAVYSCKWERHYEKRTHTLLLLILQRASKPIAIRTMFRTVSLDALADMFHQSYGLFNLMNAMWK